MQWLPPLIFCFYFVNLSHTYAESQYKISNPKEILQLIQKNHPKIIQGKLEESIDKINIEVQSQRPKLEISNELTQNPRESSHQTFKINISYPWNLSGNRQINIEKSTKNYLLTQLNSKKIQENVYKQTIIKLHQLRQIHQQIEIYKESIGAFEHINKTYQKRPTLSPEQEVEKETLDLAINAYQLKLAQLVGEAKNLQEHLNYYLGLKNQMHENAFPERLNLVAPETLIISKKLDSNTDSLTYSNLNSKDHQIIEQKIQLAQLEYKFQENKNIPDLKIGPIWEVERLPLSTEHKIGINISFDIPFLSSNSAGIEKSIAKIALLEHQKNTLVMDQEIDLKNLIDKYKHYYQLIQALTQGTSIEAKHVKIERLFKRGIIPTTLLIEFHRQMLEFNNSKIEYEMQAIKILLKIYQLQGRLSELDLL